MNDEGVSPFPDPEEPRLGIIHLLAWTACVAVSLSVARTLWMRPDAPGVTTISLLIGVAYSIGTGAALGGLLLWGSRRLHGRRFPVHPGEYLWIAVGLVVVVNLALYALLIRLAAPDGTVRFAFQAYQRYVIARTVCQIAIYGTAAVCVKVRPWRVYLWTAAVFFGLRALLELSGSYSTVVISQLLSLLPDAVLVVVVGLDLARGHRYAWTQWIGAGIVVWSDVLSVMSVVYMLWGKSG